MPSPQLLEHPTTPCQAQCNTKETVPQLHRTCEYITYNIDVYYIDMHTCIYIYIHIMHIYIYIYVCIYIHLKVSYETDTVSRSRSFLFPQLCLCSVNFTCNPQVCFGLSRCDTYIAPDQFRPWSAAWQPRLEPALQESPIP